MASFFRLTLDLTAPVLTSITLNGGQSRISTSIVPYSITATGTDIYQMKLWQSTSGTYDPTLEAAATWTSYSATGNYSLVTSVSGTTYYIWCRIRDDVGNESTTYVSSSIIYDSTAPVVTITGPDVSKISEVSGFNTSVFSFSANETINQWKVMVVQSESAAHDAATNVQIPATGGSINVTGNTEKAASEAVQVTIKGADLHTAGAEGSNIIKVFVKDLTGLWSN